MFHLLCYVSMHMILILLIHCTVCVSGLLDHARQFLQSFYNLAQTHKGMSNSCYSMIVCLLIELNNLTIPDSSIVFSGFQLFKICLSLTF